MDGLEPHENGEQKHDRQHQICLDESHSERYVVPAKKNQPSNWIHDFVFFSNGIVLHDWPVQKLEGQGPQKDHHDVDYRR